MKRFWRKLSSMVLAVLMAVTVLPAGLFAQTASAVTYNPGELISFGLYPQAKVTNSSLITALNGCVLSADNTVIYGGDKYQRVYFNQYTPHYLDLAATAENSNQDENGYIISTVYWFKFDAIQWRILSNTDGVLLVIAEKILDARVYNQLFTSVTWETCTTRSWLNSDFYNKAFSTDDKTKIKISNLANENNPWHGTSGGNNTSDKLFLLSYAETVNTTYGFNAVHDTNDTARRAQGTDFSKSSGLFVYTAAPYTGNSDWWLRSPGANQSYAGYVIKSGSSKNYTGVINTDYGIRPACRIRLTPEVYTPGDTLEFGSYPQSLITDSALLTALNTGTLAADNTVVYNGGKYKKVLFSQYDSIIGGYTGNTGLTYQDNNGYYINTVYWFKVEPLKWRVLTFKNGNMFLMADKILDAKAYNPANASITWEASGVRSWLNNEFYSAAFSAEEKSVIKTVDVVNANNPVSGAPGGNSTNDKLFLLSYADAVNTAYGFTAGVSADSARTAQGTDFSKCSGLYVNTGTPNTNNSYWWLRSPGSTAGDAGIIPFNGSVSSENTNQACLGVRPVVKVNLQSAAFIPAENSNCVVDYENKYIYGLTTGLSTLDGYVDTINGYTLSYAGTIGTGTRVNLSMNGLILDHYKAIIFGDVNGDGNVDSIDAGITVNVENNSITWNPTVDACLYMAGDVNGDGAVDGIDAGKIVDAENFLAAIGQTEEF